MENNSQTLSNNDFQKLYQYACVLCENDDDAYDIFQTSVASYLFDIEHGKNIQNPFGFVQRVIKNRFIDHYRHNLRWKKTVYDEDDEYNISPIDIDNAIITEKTLEAIWKELSAQEREILYYWSILGHSTDEACKILDIPRGTFLSRIHRLRKKHKEFSFDKQLNQGLK